MAPAMRVSSAISHGAGAWRPYPRKPPVGRPEGSRRHPAVSRATARQPRVHPKRHPGAPPGRADPSSRGPQSAAQHAARGLPRVRGRALGGRNQCEAHDACSSEAWRRRACWPRCPRWRSRQRSPRSNTGDTAWLLISTALVMVMLPGLALFYGGLVRRKNVLSTIMHSFFGLALVSVVWVLVGFSLAFGSDVGGLGLDRRPRLRRASSTSASSPTRPTARRSRSSCSRPSS